MAPHKQCGRDESVLSATISGVEPYRTVTNVRNPRVLAGSAESRLRIAGRSLTRKACGRWQAVKRLWYLNAVAVYTQFLQMMRGSRVG